MAAAPPKTMAIADFLMRLDMMRSFWVESGRTGSVAVVPWVCAAIVRFGTCTLRDAAVHVPFMYQPLQQDSAPGDSPDPTQGVVTTTPRPSTYASRHERRRLYAGVAAVAMAVPLLSLPADGIAHDHERRQRSDHDEARRALLSGKVLSLRQVLDIVAREYPG